MSTHLTVRAPAKINLHLGVGPLREDGFHPLATVYQAIGLYDDVTVTEAAEWSLSVTSHDGGPGGAVDLVDVPTDASNLALRAAHLLADHHEISACAAIHVEKGIPVAGGLAGGSADAAATLLALDRLWLLETPDEDLLALAARLGSDVPFALVGGTATGHGRGEVVEPVTDIGSWWWVVVESERGLSTPAVYAELDRGRRERPARRAAAGEQQDPTPEIPARLLASLEDGDPEHLAISLGNDLTAPALALRPELAEVMRAGEEASALASLLSGSGPTCLFLCGDAEHAMTVRAAMLERGHTRVRTAPAPVAGAHVVDLAPGVSALGQQSPQSPLSPVSD